MASPLEAPIDLSMAAVAEPARGLLVVTSQMTPARQAAAAAFAVAALLLAFQAWRSRADGWAAVILPFGMLAPFFLIIAAVLAFGRQQKSYRRGSGEITGGLGPLSDRLEYPLPESGVVRVTVREERSGSSNRRTAVAARWYDVGVDGFPALGLTSKGDPAAARGAAAKLSAVLGYPVRDESR